MPPDFHFKRFALVTGLGKSMKLLITSLFLFWGLRASTSACSSLTGGCFHDAPKGWALLGEGLPVIVAVRRKSKNDGRGEEHADSDDLSR